MHTALGIQDKYHIGTDDLTKRSQASENRNSTPKSEFEMLICCLDLTVRHCLPWLAAQ